MPKRPPQSLAEMEMRARGINVDPRKEKLDRVDHKKELWSKAEFMFMIQKAIKTVPVNSPSWVNLIKQYAQCRGFYAEPSQQQGTNITQVIALRHFDNEEEFYAEAKKQQILLEEKNRKVIEQMESEREQRLLED